MQKMLYQWSEDGEAEQCTVEEIEINTPIEWCYHCGVPIEVGKAIKVTTRTDNYNDSAHSSLGRSCERPGFSALNHYKLPFLFFP